MISGELTHISVLFKIRIVLFNTYDTMCMPQGIFNPKYVLPVTSDSSTFFMLYIYEWVDLKWPILDFKTMRRNMIKATESSRLGWSFKKWREKCFKWFCA